MKTAIFSRAMHGVAWAAIVMAAGAATPAAAELVESSDALVQKARPMADSLLRKQLCARSGVAGDCRDGLPSVKQDLLLVPFDDGVAGPDELPPLVPVAEIPPLQELLPPPALFEQPPAMVPAAAVAASVPEPSTIGVLLLAAVGLAVRRARRP